MSGKRHTPEDEPYFLVRTLAAEFRDGHALAAHTHPWGQLLYAASGVMSVWTAQGSWVAPPHWAVWAPAGVAHAMRFTGAASVRTLYLRPDPLRLPAKSAVIAVSPLLRELILRAVATRFLDAREPAHSAMTELILHELRTQETPALDLRMPRSAVARRVAEHITRAPGNRMSQAALAKQFGIGARTLERTFQAETGLSFGQWRRQARFLHALRCMGSGSPVKQAAVDAGYAHASAFVAAFRVTFHTTPGQYFQTGRM